MMKLLICIFSIAFLGFSSNAQTVTGKWKTVNDETGKANSIIEIFEEDGEIHGRILRILKEEDRQKTCASCSGEMKDEPIEGLIVMTGLEKDGDEYTGGKITDPDSGKEYKCKIWLDSENPDILNVRGYIAFFYRTQTWIRDK